MSLIDDYNYCENIIKIYSKSFYAAFSILPKPKRNAVYAIYAFCRYADDSIDVLNSLDKLLKLESYLDQLRQGNRVDLPIFRALEDTFKTFDLDISPFYDMIQGQKMDFNFIQPKDINEFKKYCYHVAGSVGLSAAVRLQTAGYEVEIFEQENMPGGKMHQIKDSGHTFDVGPTLVMMPSIYQDLFIQAGRNPDDYIPMTRLDPMYEVYFKDKPYRHYKVNGELTDLMKIMESKGPANASGF